MTFPYIWPLPAISGVCFLIALLSKQRPEDKAKATAAPGPQAAAAPLPARPGSAPLPTGARPKVALYTRSSGTDSLAVAAAPTLPSVGEPNTAVTAPPEPTEAALAPPAIDATETPTEPEHGHVYVASGSFATRPDVVGMVYDEMHVRNGHSTNGRVADVIRAAAPSMPAVVSAAVREQSAVASSVEEADDEAPGFLGFSTMEIGDGVVPAATVPDAFAGLLTPQAVAALAPDELQPRARR